MNNGNVTVAHESGPRSHAHRLVDFPSDKWFWSPSPLLGQVVLVTTVDAHGQVCVAPKSWVTVVAGTGPLVGFGCTREHGTVARAEAAGQFVINVPGRSLARAIFEMPITDDRLTSAGLTVSPGRTVAVPIIDQCPAVLECVWTQTVEFDNDEVFVIGRVTRIAVDEALTHGDTSGRYEGLAPFFFCEQSVWAGLGATQSVSEMDE
ncbi:MAG: flavin reductase family protein [Propionibacteriaceae bacterium]|nr:flavin reductase family protein [Propionibacteriaceae bacterium]